MSITNTLLIMSMIFSVTAVLSLLLPIKQITIEKDKVINNEVVKHNFSREELELFDIFNKLLLKNHQCDINGNHYELVSKDMFMYNGKIYDLTIENFFKTLNDEKED